MLKHPYFLYTQKEKHLKNIELLAPVGNKDSLLAAVNNGADAIYLGAKTFSARESADNFTDDELIKAITYCHLRNVRVYIAINTLLKDREIDQAIELIRPLYNEGVDSIIVQDFGAADIIKQTFKGLPLHASTQLGVHNVSGALLAEEFGFNRAILSREVTIQGIKEIKKNVNIEIESFVHGALCSSFSGQCLFSSFIGGRSGNRGRCAQPCRLYYELFENNASMKNGYLLSTKEMCTIDILKDFMDAGVSSFKIEGRARRAEYVSLAVRSYRTAIDAILNGKAADTKEILDDLTKMYNRGGFGSGYYISNRNMTAIERPNNWGILVGKVIKTDKNKIYIKSEKGLFKGDGIEFVKGTSKGSCALNSIEKTGRDIYAISYVKGVENGDLVYRNSDINLLNREKENIAKENKIKLSAVFQAHIGQNAVLTIEDENGLKVSTSSTNSVEKSQKPFDMEREAKRSINKTGGTDFEFSDINVTASESSWMPISEIASMRRDCLEKITKKRLEQIRLYKTLDINIVNRNYSYGQKDINKELILQTGNLDNIKTAVKNGIHKIFYDPENFNEENLKKIEDFKEFSKIYIKIPNILLNTDEQTVKGLLEKYADIFAGAVISHITQINMAKEYFKDIISGQEVNVFNSSSCNYLYKSGINECVLSPELNIKQADAIAAFRKILIVQGKLTLMNLPHCPIQSIRKCNCQGLDGVYLKDRKGYMLPLKRTKINTCNVKVLNSVELSALPLINEIIKADISELLIIDEDYNAKKLLEIINAYKKALKGELTEAEISDISKQTTRGHLNKGVL